MKVIRIWAGSTVALISLWRKFRVYALLKLALYLNWLKPNYFFNKLYLKLYALLQVAKAKLLLIWNHQ